MRINRTITCFALGLLVGGQAFSQSPLPPTPGPASTPPTPPLAPAAAPVEPKRVILIQPPPQVFQPRVIPQAGTPGVIPRVVPGTPQIPIVPQPAAPAVPQQPATALVWDAETKEVTAKPGDANAEFIFYLTNVYTETVQINSVRTTCGCTVAKLPEVPWKIPPGGSGPIHVTMNLAGKSGTIGKGVTVESSAGIKTLTVKTIIPNDPVAAAAQGDNMNRLKNMQTAMNDRQAVFKGECAKCHVEPGVGKMGKDLYTASCGICHDSPHRAGVVPDLYALKHPTNSEYWKHWTINGKPGSMMPAFATSQEGPLTDEQIVSLVKYLDETVTAKTAAGSPTTAVKPGPLVIDPLH